MNPVSSGLNLFSWLFLRLPLGFSIPFTAMSLWWVFAGFRLANDHFAAPIAAAVGSILESPLPTAIGLSLVSGLEAFIHATVVIVLFALGFVVTSTLSAFLNWGLVVSRLNPVPHTAEPWRQPRENANPHDAVPNTRRT